MKCNKRAAHCGFTLIETLVVLAIIAVLISMAGPSIIKSARSAALTLDGQSVADVFTLAQQTALTKSIQAEVRIYKLPGYSEKTDASPLVYRALQSFVINGACTNVIGKVVFLQQPIIISDSMSASPLINRLEKLPAPDAVAVPGYGTNYNYVAFRFNVNGSTDLPSGESLYLSLYDSKDKKSNSEVLPSNHVSIQIDPLTGRNKMIRP